MARATSRMSEGPCHPIVHAGGVVDPEAKPEGMLFAVSVHHHEILPGLGLDLREVALRLTLRAGSRVNRSIIYYTTMDALP